MLLFQLSAILREVHYLKLLNHPNLPHAALQMAERNEILRKYISNLNLTIDWYNKIRRTTKEVEYNLIESKINDIDKLIEQGQTILNWETESKLNYFCCSFFT